ncbi:MAG: hypothetical protein HOE90_08970 [Bacteriovoracaceae bacterium]|jgi:spore photoproduct lyase|nr:hypothetical protein [Bacteriovoracaceae bacterium]
MEPVEIDHKLVTFKESTLFHFLKKPQRDFLEDAQKTHGFSFQEFKQLVDISIDFFMWGEGDISEYWPTDLNKNLNSKQLKKSIFQKVKNSWEEIKASEKDYSSFHQTAGKYVNTIKVKTLPSTKPLNNKILGKCPVASEKTLCCNLQTLDTIANCGFGCTYCSIQTFNSDKDIFFETNLLEKLRAANLDPKKRYHIGTGQSSDSLFLGNKGGILDDLMTFCRENPNIILEFKTKSNNVKFFLENEIPSNVICTWTLNPSEIIKSEEYFTASLEQRIRSARELADKGVLVGFHFHPMFYYSNFNEDYERICQILTESFLASEVALVSLGTLTFTKNVITHIRKSGVMSKVLQMPLVQADGKLSYSADIKVEMFSHLYQSLKPWHDHVFFYLCMENKSLWKPVFGYEYESNVEFEKSMLDSYFQKVAQASTPIELT